MAGSTSAGYKTECCAAFLPGLNSRQICRLLKRLGVHGLPKKAGHTYKYYGTQFGKDILAAGLKFPELVIIPQQAYGRAR